MTRRHEINPDGSSMMVNVLHINRSDGAGGASIAMQRLHHGLLDAGHDSRLLVDKSIHPDPRTHVIRDHVKARISLSDRVRRRLDQRLHKRVDSDPAAHRHLWKIPELPIFRQAQALNFHNLHSDYFNIRVLPALAVKPIVWTLHDMWALTGHCAYSYECDRWESGCFDCPLLKEPGRRMVEPPPTPTDVSKPEWELKDALYREHGHLIHAVAPSRWLCDFAGRGILRHAAGVHCIPYGIDLEEFAPVDRSLARQVLGITRDRGILLAATLKRGRRTAESFLRVLDRRHGPTTSDKLMNMGRSKKVIFASSLHRGRKGAEYLIQALDRLEDRSSICLLVCGGGAVGDISRHIETINIGLTTHSALQRLAYCAADLFVLPTLADNLPLTVLESMACGVPVVAFDAGGVRELVHHGETGYLARYKDPDDLARGIAGLMADDAARARMGRAGRELVEREYPLRLQAERYLKVYEQAIEQARTAGAKP